MSTVTLSAVLSVCTDYLFETGTLHGCLRAAGLDGDGCDVKVFCNEYCRVTLTRGPDSPTSPFYYHDYVQHAVTVFGRVFDTKVSSVRRCWNAFVEDIGRRFPGAKVRVCALEIGMEE